MDSVGLLYDGFSTSGVANLKYEVAAAAEALPSRRLISSQFNAAAGGGGSGCSSFTTTLPKLTRLSIHIFSHHWEIILDLDIGKVFLVDENSVNF